MKTLNTTLISTIIFTALTSLAFADNQHDLDAINQFDSEYSGITGDSELVTDPKALQIISRFDSESSTPVGALKKVDIAVMEASYKTTHDQVSHSGAEKIFDLLDSEN